MADPKASATTPKSTDHFSENRDPTASLYREHRLDPWQTPEEITEAMRELAEEAEDDERRRLQGIWRELTLKREDQLETAFFAHAHPMKGWGPVEAMSAEELKRRFRLGGRTVTLPQSLVEFRPDVADLVVLPPLMLTGSDRPQSAPEEWSDVPPDEDILLKL